MIPDDLWRRPCPSPETIQYDNISPCPRNAACNGGDIVYGSNLDEDRLLISRRLFDGIHKLAQVLYGIDIMMRRRRDGIRTPRDHPGLCDIRIHLLPRQMPSDPWLCPLSDLDLYCCGRLEIVAADGGPAAGPLPHPSAGRRTQPPVEPR